MKFKPKANFDYIEHKNGFTLLVKGNKVIQISDWDETTYWGFEHLLAQKPSKAKERGEE